MKDIIAEYVLVKIAEDIRNLSMEKKSNFLVDLPLNTLLFTSGTGGLLGSLWYLLNRQIDVDEYKSKKRMDPISRKIKQLKNERKDWTYQ